MNALTTQGLAVMTVAIALGTCPSLAFEPIMTLHGERPIIHPPGADIEVLASRDQTDGQFGIVIINAKPGDGPGPAITNHRGSETWYVLEGQFEFHVADYRFTGDRGAFVSVDAGQQHGFIAKKAGKLLVLFQPGGYEQFFVEWNKTQVPKGAEAAMLERQYGVTRP